MEAKWTKVLDNGNRIVVKQIPEGRTWDSNRSGLKRKRFNDCKTKCPTCLRKSSLKNYSNFMESGLPNRVLFYENNEWNDFPPNVVELVREHFVLKNAAVEVKFDDCHYLLDILYMIKCDLRNGAQKHIGWIDEAGGRFFPDVGAQESGQSEIERDGGLVLQIPEGDREIKLELQIDIGGAPVCGLEGCVEESNSPAKRIKIRRKIVGNDDDDNDERIDGDQESFVKVEVAVEGDQNGSDEVAKRVGPAIQALDPDTVRKIFLSGMAALDGRTEVVEVRACSRHLMQTRLEIFEKQVEITRDRRGDANVKYAWLAADKDALHSLMVYGLGAGGFSSILQSSSGVYLSPINLPYISASASKCAADQDGMQHLVLCRVILGKVEQVRPGSEQVLPSDVNFDSGVDCLHNPCRYLVWSMNTSTHIFPEYLVSFRTESKSEESYLLIMPRIKSFWNKYKFAVVANRKYPEVWTNACRCVADTLLWKESTDVVLKKAAGQVFKGGMQLQRSPEGTSPPLLNAAKAAKSPWMPFPMLFDAISKEVASTKMNTIYAHYELFVKKKINREDFVSWLRILVGDELLRSTLLNLQGKLPQVPNAVIQSLQFQCRSKNAEASV